MNNVYSTFTMIILNLLCRFNVKLKFHLISTDNRHASLFTNDKPLWLIFIRFDKLKTENLLSFTKINVKSTGVYCIHDFILLHFFCDQVLVVFSSQMLWQVTRNATTSKSSPNYRPASNMRYAIPSRENGRKKRIFSHLKLTRFVIHFMNDTQVKRFHVK